MAEAVRKRCLVAIDGAVGPLLLEVDLAVDENIAAALERARSVAAQRGLPVAIDWEGAATGIWGQRCERTRVPRDGDRIELYRPLPADPRERRRRRAAERGS